MKVEIEKLRSEVKFNESDAEHWAEKAERLRAEIERLTAALADGEPLRRTIGFLMSVARCGEPITAEVEQAYSNAMERCDRMAAALGADDD